MVMFCHLEMSHYSVTLLLYHKRQIAGLHGRICELINLSVVPRKPYKNTSGGE